MTKSRVLEVLMLLSALESWSFSVKSPLPKDIQQKIDELIKELSDVVLDRIGDV